MIVKFKEIADYVAGQSPESKYYSNTEGVPFLQGNRTFGLFYPTIDTYTKKITKIAKKGDILMSVRAPVGDLNIAKEDLCIGRGLSAISSKTGNNIFLFYSLKYNIQNLIRQSSGTTFDSITRDVIENMNMIIPDDKSIHLKISKLLFDIDLKIDINNKINVELESMAKTLYDYWFLQFEFPNEEGKPYKSSGGEMVYNSTIKRDIPKSWQVVNLRNTKLCKLIKTGIDYFEGEKIYLATSDLEGTEIINDSEKIHFENRLSRANMQPIVNSVWFAKMKNTTKNLLLNEASKDIINNYILSTGLSGLSCNKNTLYYLWNYIAGEYFEKKKDLVASGATQQAINESDLSDFIIIEPNQDLLAKYTRLVAPIYLTINKNKQQNKHLAELRDFLLPLLMNGQVTVRA